jgi:hypothetical protein
MRDHIANHSALDSAENVLSFQSSPNSKMNPGAAALDVVYQAAELSRCGCRCHSVKAAAPNGAVSNRQLQKQSIQRPTALIADFCNKIC